MREKNIIELCVYYALKCTGLPGFIGTKGDKGEPGLAPPPGSKGERGLPGKTYFKILYKNKHFMLIILNQMFFNFF